MWQKGMKSIQDRVSSLFYSHGLFCSSHPFAIISLVITIILITSYPLTTLPLPGNAPLQYKSPSNDYQVPPTLPPDSQEPETADKKPRWYRGPPIAYVMQVVVKSTVSPWHPIKLISTDAFRGPLSQVFDVVQQIQNFQLREGTKKFSFGDVCMHVHETSFKKNAKGLLPSYNCLIVSPANFWRQDKSKFDSDDKLVKTITKSYGQPLDVPPTIRDLLFGVPWKDTGIRSIFLRNRQRVISYSVTLLFKEYKESYIQALKQHLEQKYPRRLFANGSHVDNLVHIYFKDINYFVEYTPLLVAYIVLFLYLYFSVRKINMVKSKWGLALSAVVTVVSSLLMSIGICTLFGMTPSLNGSEIFPYLVVIIGLENVLVVTKSVVSTEVHLDVKLRVAQGLRKEGWSIFKNLMTELLILAVGFFTFVPAIQEFCLFAVVGLLSDFFLQMFFFTTVLSIDIRRMELSDLQGQALQQENNIDHGPSPANKTSLSAPQNNHHNPYMQRPNARPYNPTRGPSTCLPLPLDDFLFPDPLARPPKRVRFMNIWAETRFMQRAIMVCVVMWIALIAYKSGLVEHLVEASLKKVTRPQNRCPSDPQTVTQAAAPQPHLPHNIVEDGGTVPSVDKVVPTGNEEKLDDDLKYVNSLLTHRNLEQWRELSYNHWPTLLSYYNMTMLGRYITVIPSLHLSIVIPSERAVSMRHPEDPVVTEPDPSTTPTPPPELDPFLKFLLSLITRIFRQPQSRTELVMTVLLGIASFILVTYFFTALYKIMCGRGYGRGRRSDRPRYHKQIRAEPRVLDGHTQEVEVLVTEEKDIISSCLGGQIRVWNSVNGECVLLIDRTRQSFPFRRLGVDVRHPDPESNIPPPVTRGHTRTGSLDVSQLSLYPRHPQPPSPIDTYPPISMAIDTDFNAMSAQRGAASIQDTSYQPSPTPQNPTSDQRGYNFGPFCHYTGEYEYGGWDGYRDVGGGDGGWGRTRSLSQGDTPDVAPEEGVLRDYDSTEELAPPVWCLACQNPLIVAGCGDGKIEYWDRLDGVQKYVQKDNPIGVTSICIVGNRLIAARLNGVLEFIALELWGSFGNHTRTNSAHTTGPRPRSGWHKRTGSLGGAKGEARIWADAIRITVIASFRAHQHPINILKAEGGRVVTASQDRTLRVYDVEDAILLHTLHGHNGGVTSLFLDKGVPLTAASGAEDGTVRLWDISSGSCVHKLRGHSGTVTTVTCTDLFVISVGTDDLLCIWERCKGHLMHWIQMEPGYCNTVAMLTSRLMVTGGLGYLHLWDVSKGEVLRAVAPSGADTSISVRYLSVIDNSTVVCDYGSQLQVIHFPYVLEKVD